MHKFVLKVQNICVDEPEVTEVPTVSNVRQDLNEWQAKHATIVLSAVKVLYSPSVSFSSSNK